MRISILSLETILGQPGKRVGVVNLWSIHHLPTHPSRVKLEICWKISKVRCYKPCLTIGDHEHQKEARGSRESPGHLLS